MSNRISDHLSESDRTFLRALETTSPGTILKVTPGASQLKPPGPLKPSHNRNDIDELLAELGAIMFHQNHRSR